MIVGRWPCETYICILKRIVAMIPSMSVLKSAPSICETISLSNGALGHTIDTVHLISVELSDTMPVNCCTIEVVIVLHMDYELISPASLYQRRRERIVEDFSCRLFETVGGKLYLRIV